ncbi:hypothetical protein K504DRAFT_464945 [Pleomassaria siparia CBS 279.74]|uniref:Uncharacterized protein n=1 Tax=Pleomassaria siparia CBS 279.74 TaxID=1314801 RepID=A0A6G1JPZ0_9PLEO|nr:hypothetical protein K504DRAFT_464945 [Pleomassaria siparia CBS 279.74]
MVYPARRLDQYVQYSHLILILILILITISGRASSERTCRRSARLRPYQKHQSFTDRRLVTKSQAFSRLGNMPFLSHIRSAPVTRQPATSDHASDQTD